MHPSCVGDSDGEIVSVCCTRILSGVGSDSGVWSGGERGERTRLTVLTLTHKPEDYRQTHTQHILPEL